MTTQRKTLTDANVRALKPAAPGKRYDVYDTLIPNLLVRTTATSKGHKTFALRAKFPGKADRVRREIGEAGRLTVEDARTTARDWLSALARGLDPSASSSAGRDRPSLLPRWRNSGSRRACATRSARRPTLSASCGLMFCLSGATVR